MQKVVSSSTVLLLLMVILAFRPVGETVTTVPGFELTGKITGYADKYIYLAHTENGAPVTDSCLVKDGSFSFKIKSKLTEPQQLFLYSKNRRLQKVFYAENAVMKVSGDAATNLIVISGSKSQDEYAALEDEVNIHRQKVMKLWQAADSLKKEADKLYNQEADIRKQFVVSHPKSFVSLQELLNWTNDQNYKEAKEIYTALDPSVRKTEKAKEIEVRLANLEKVALGNPAIDFAQKDIHGKLVSLSAYKGKYVLLEFWASWCGPCRAENPNLREAYKKYQDKGFNILAVSLDDDADKWKKAVDKDALPWAQISDLKGWSNEAAVQYGIRAIPANFLIDPQGKIVKRDLRGEELNKALAELFN